MDGRPPVRADLLHLAHGLDEALPRPGRIVPPLRRLGDAGGAQHAAVVDQGQRLGHVGEGEPVGLALPLRAVLEQHLVELPRVHPVPPVEVGEVLRDPQLRRQVRRAVDLEHVRGLPGGDHGDQLLHVLHGPAGADGQLDRDLGLGGLELGQELGRLLHLRRVEVLVPLDRRRLAAVPCRQLGGGSAAAGRRQRRERPSGTNSQHFPAAAHRRKRAGRTTTRRQPPGAQDVPGIHVQSPPERLHARPPARLCARAHGAW